MMPLDVAELLEDFASKVTKLPGVSRTNPHAFAEAKSELAGELRRKARDLRIVPRAPGAPVSTIRLGTRTIGTRDVAVERRQRA